MNPKFIYQNCSAKICVSPMLVIFLKKILLDNSYYFSGKYFFGAVRNAKVFSKSLFLAVRGDIE